MGFLDKLLKKEAGKIISGVVDQVMDNVMDSAKEVLNQAGFGEGASETAPQMGAGAGKGFTVSLDEEHCGGDAEVIEGRIYKVLAKDFADCEIRKNVKSESIGIFEPAYTYTYGIYRDNVAVAMINVLDNPNDYKKKSVLQSKQACADRSISYVHFLQHLPNRYSYIEKQIKNLLTV